MTERKQKLIKARMRATAKAPPSPTIYFRPFAGSTVALFDGLRWKNLRIIEKIIPIKPSKNRKRKRIT